MAIPLQKLKFVNHPRYGQVYPFVCIDRRHEWASTARASLVMLTIFNGLTFYSTFYMPIFTASFSAIVANPMVLIPSCILNGYMYQRFYALFYGQRSLVTSMFLMPCGRKFICETRDGDSAQVTITDIFMKKYLQTRFDDRVEFQHGANQYKQIRGNARIMDWWVLDNVLDNKNIDTKNVEYDFDFTKEFTWDFRELVEIKKRKRFVLRTYKPTIKVLSSVRSAMSFEKAKKRGKVQTKREAYQGYELYDFVPDNTYNDNRDNASDATAQHALNVNSAGRDVSQVVETNKREGGRRVKKLVTAL